MPYPESSRQAPDTRPGSIKLLFYPALTAMLLLRHHLGVRLIRSSKLMVAVAVLGTYGFIASFIDPSARLMYVLAIAALMAGIGHRIRRSHRQRAGENIHTYNMGCSYLGLALHARPGRGNRTERYLDPLVCTLLAAALWRYAPAVSLWVAFSGIALFAIERHVYEIQRDYHDTVVKTATLVAASTETHAAKPGKASTARNAIPAGVGKDISGQIAAGKSQKPPQKGP